MLEPLNRIEPFLSLGLRLESLSPDEAVIFLPLAGNRNDKGSCFAGSLYSALVLAGWCLTMKFCAEGGEEWEAVVKSSQVSFPRPATTDCRMVARLEGTPQPKGEGRWAVAVVVEAHDVHDRVCAVFRGEFRGFRRRTVAREADPETGGSE